MYIYVDDFFFLSFFVVQQPVTSYTLPSHLTTIGRGVCCIRKRENDRKVRSIVD